MRIFMDGNFLERVGGWSIFYNLLKYVRYI